MDNNPATPETSEPKPHVKAPVDEQRLRTVLDNYGTPLTIGVAIAAVVLIGVSWYRNHQRSGEEKASEMLSVAVNTRQLEEIRSQYPATFASQVATLALAKSSYDAGNYDAASRAYTEFAKKYPTHLMAPAAKLGEIHCLEAVGQTEEAASGFASFVSNYPHHYLVPVALFGEARTFEQLGRTQEAKAVYEDFIAAHPKNPRVRDAEAALAELSEKLAKAKP